MENLNINSWLIEGHVVLSVSPEISRDEDMPALDAALITYLEEASGDQVHIIFDISEQVRSPGLKATTALKFPKHPRMGWSVVIGQKNPVVKTMASLAGKIIKTRFRFMDTQEDALEFLRAIDLSIPVDESAVITS